MDDDKDLQVRAKRKRFEALFILAVVFNGQCVLILQRNRGVDRSRVQPAIGRAGVKVMGQQEKGRIQILKMDPAPFFEWFRSQGPGYQTRINRLLRRYMEVQQRRR